MMTFATNATNTTTASTHSHSHSSHQDTSIIQSGWCRQKLNGGIFIRSPTEEGGSELEQVRKLSLSEEHPVEVIEKSAAFTSVQEAIDMTISRSEPQPITSPVRGRRLQSWLSYLKSGAVLSTSPLPSPLPSPEPSSQSTSPRSSGKASPPRRGILKVKPITSDKASHPAPIQKATFLRHEHATRMSRFAISPPTHRHTLDHLHDFIYERRSGFPGSKVRFDLQKNNIWETYGREDYDRAGVEYIARALTPEVAHMIKKELNEVKSEMEVHEESKHYTQFYTIKTC